MSPQLRESVKLLSESSKMYEKNMQDQFVQMMCLG